MTDMTENKISIPDFCLVLMVGPSGCGKSTFAAQHFKETEIISSDRCRALVSDDENDQDATKDAFELVNFILEKRLAARRLTVVDATNVRSEDRGKLVRLAKKYHALTVAFVFQLPAEICQQRNRDRTDRQLGNHVVRNQMQSLKRGLKRMKNEGIRYQYRLNSPEEVAAVNIERQRLWTDKQEDSGPFDIIGDVHGCATELEQLLEKLGYQVDRQGAAGDIRYHITPPKGRRVIFLGDLVDRGPRTPDSLRIAKTMVEAGQALAICGNHENKLVRKLKGRDVKLNHGLAESVEQLDAEQEDFRTEVRDFMDGLVSHYLLDGGKLVVAHAGIREDMQGRSSGAVRNFCMYGETTGETDEFGLPVRYDWARDYRGKAKVIYGHTPVPEAEWVNGTLCIDTGCVFGGKLTALRYPEMELVEQQAAEVYCEPVRPLTNNTAPASNDLVLHLEDVAGKRVIHTNFGHAITLQEDQSVAALEVASRFSVDPRWMIYLPPTMSPVESASLDGYLERPEEAFDHYRRMGQKTVICEEKHMGSRAVIVLCRDEEVAERRFMMSGAGLGCIYTRTGRPFFPTDGREQQILQRLSTAAETSGLWEELDSNWLCLDAEILPWSVKAQSLIEEQYAPVGAAAESALATAGDLLQAGIARGLDLGNLKDSVSGKLACVQKYRAAYQPYIWPVAELEDISIAPFHLLASEGSVHHDKTHLWHMEICHRLASADPALLQATQYRQVDLADEAACAEAAQWWDEMTAGGGEGMVVKPLEFLAKGKRGLIQPAVKVRGHEYLRIIYGADYDQPDTLSRLRNRSLGKKRGLALKEFALGLTALDRFVQHASLRQVHECAVGVLAMESDPIDPRL